MHTHTHTHVSHTWHTNTRTGIYKHKYKMGRSGNFMSHLTELCEASNWKETRGCQEGSMNVFGLPLSYATWLCLWKCGWMLCAWVCLGCSCVIGHSCRWSAHKNINTKSKKIKTCNGCEWPVWFIPYRNGPAHKYKQEAFGRGCVFVETETRNIHIRICL